MNTDDLQGESWEEFKREFGLDSWQTPERFAAQGASLAPLRAEAERLGFGRPRKQPPVFVADGMRYCWACKSALPLASFNIDRWRADGLKLNCRKCDGTARARRKRERYARLNSRAAEHA
ncbi:MAG TPA: hypothetical protein VF695_07095 [Sphingomonas sp.]|jgi:hypothetical protein